MKIEKRGERRKMRKREDKKGEVSSTQIILLVLSIVGFIVVLLFLTGLNLGWFSESELCRLSVLSRAISPQSAQGYIPLKCTTKKICVSGEGNCEQEFAGEKIIKEKIKLNDKSVAEEDAIAKQMADAMYDCWSTMGEGKLSLFSTGAKQELGLDAAELTCVICSRIGFDFSKEKEEELFGKIVGNELIKGKVDVNKFMKENQVPGKGVTYMQAFTDRTMSSYVAETPEIRAEQQGVIEKSVASGNIFKSNTNEMAVVFSQVKPTGYAVVLKNLGKVGAITIGSTFMTPGIGKLAGKVLANPYGLAVATVAAGGVVAYSMSNVYEGRATSAGYCGEFTSSDEKAREGCSVVQIVPYEPSAINKICHAIDGNP